MIFRAFDWNNHGQLTYQEVLSGVAAMDPSTPHGGPSGELRCRYIFRCYSAEQESCLSFEGFKWVVLLVLLDRLKMVLRDYHGLSMVKSSYVTKNLMATQWLTQISFFILLSIKAWWSSLLSIECSHGHLSYPAQNFLLIFLILIVLRGQPDVQFDYVELENEDCGCKN